MFAFVCSSFCFFDLINATSELPIQVAIFNGSGALPSCVSRTESTIQAYVNNNPGVTINTKRIDHIDNIDDLSGVDILIMPGGTHGYTYLDNTNNSAVREFVKSGHGYIGICAGAYAGANQVDDRYKSYGVAPHINCIAAYHEGLTKLTMTSEGNRILGMPNSEYVMDHENGPVMYSNSVGAVSLATYNGIEGIGHSGSIAIAFDEYYNGKTILFGPHPESDDPNYPSMLGNAIKFIASKGSTNLSVDMPNTISVNQTMKMVVNLSNEFGIGLNDKNISINLRYLNDSVNTSDLIMENYNLENIGYDGRTNVDGLIHFNLTLNSTGVYEFSAWFPGDEGHNSSNIYSKKLNVTDNQINNKGIYSIYNDISDNKFDSGLGECGFPLVILFISMIVVLVCWKK
ncbi:MAG: hypothetical protein LBR15_01630 [Methanobrevibacter sp.]|jgi:glutamine amidotransferase-like uncharacterized protein|nr:hypothetical protein [Candidatus Methanovirga australis]